MKDKAYYEDVNIKNELKLRDMIQKLPKFCMDFFIGIDADKSSRTKIAYADLFRVHEECQSIA